MKMCHLASEHPAGPWSSALWDIPGAGQDNHCRILWLKHTELLLDTNLCQ